LVKLVYGSREDLKRCLQDPERRVLFHPDLHEEVEVGSILDVEVGFDDSAILFPMQALCSGRRLISKGSHFPPGLFFEIIKQDADRYRRLCNFAYDTWRPRIGRKKRYRTELAVTYRYSFSMHKGKTRDISAQGMFIRSDNPIPSQGEDLIVRLKPFWYSRPLILDARVCWVDEVESRRGMGLKCSNPDGLNRLEALVRRLQDQAEAA
jgi:hypothetical protein